MNAADNGRETERFFDLLDMLHTDAFKSPASPAVMDGSVGRRRPEMFIAVDVFRDEIEVKQRVVVNELERCVLRFLADCRKLSDEATLLKFLQCF